MLVLILRCFPGLQRSPPAGWIPVRFLYRVHVFYGAQSPPICDLGSIFQRANISRGKYLHLV